VFVVAPLGDIAQDGLLRCDLSGVADLLLAFFRWFRFAQPPANTF
jgi:hypothetical protein